MNDLFLGLDVGTSHIKAVLATAEGRVLAQAHTQYPTHHPQPGWAEQDPEDWWQGVVEVTRAVAGAAPEKIRGIGVSGQGCAVTLVDAAGEVIRPAIIWMDTRSEPQCERLRNCCGAEILERNGKSPAPYNADPVLMWLKEYEPDSIAAADCSLTTTAYINFRLTGEKAANLSDASILFAFDLEHKTWSDELIQTFRLPSRLYPRVAPCSQVTGELTPAAAASLGLQPGIPVVAGGEDTSSAGLACGCVEPGQAFLSLGTAGTIYLCQAERVVHPQLLTFLHVLPDRYLIGGSMVAIGAALSWCRQLFKDPLDYDALTSLAAESEPGAGRLIFLPYLSGELQPVNDGYARGVFFGLHLNTSRPQLIRSVMEGTAYAIAHNLGIAEEMGAPIRELRAVGGPTRSPLWCQIIADVTGRRLGVLSDDFGAPLGNALLAAAGTRWTGDLASTAARSARIAQYYDPNPRLRARYKALFAIYQQLYPQLKPQFADLSRVP